MFFWLGTSILKILKIVRVELIVDSSQIRVDLEIGIEWHNNTKRSTLADTFIADSNGMAL